MGLFGGKTTRFLGVDIGSASIKITELENNKGEPWLKNYGFAEKILHNESNRTDDVINQSADIIKKISRKAGFGTNDAVAALHNFDVFTSILNLPHVSTEEVEEIVKVEARKFVPIPLEDVVIDWKRVTDPLSNTQAVNQQGVKDKNRRDKKDSVTTLGESKDKGMDILLTAAPRKLIRRYVDIVKAAELNLLSLETESFAFIRALLDTHDTTSVMVIDFGAVATDIIIVENQIPVIIRSVDVGGSSITSAIERNLTISRQRAEQFKRDIGFKGTQTSESEVIIQLIEATFAPVVNEINYSIDLYKSRNRVLEKIIITGGSAYLQGLTNFLKATFGLPVFIGDPWHKVTYPEKIKTTLEGIGPMFTVSIGLALKEIIEK